MQTVEIVPSPAALVQSLRGLGYSPGTALADLIDNSLAAAASLIEIGLDWSDGDPRVVVLDDGRGMDKSGLEAAMRFGGAGPAVTRNQDDLGRFGLGLKTASLCQCRRLTVITRQNGKTSALCWDVDEVERSGSWRAIIPPFPDIPAVHQLQRCSHGTVVVWDKMDALAGLWGLDRESFFIRVQDIHQYLGMIFHRFLSGDARRVTLSVNGRNVRGWDPFQRSHPATITMPTEPMRYREAVVRVTPYILPHRDRFANESEYEEAGGPGGWSERQGFYVYRQKRLLVPGGWLGLGGTRAWTREESSRLARIAIDLPSSLDVDWRIDVRKSQARPPGPMRERLTAVSARCRDKAREVFAWRGQRVRGQLNGEGNEQPIWITDSRRQGSRYRVNREHPAVQSVLRNVGKEAALVDALLTLVGKSVPVERIWLDVSESDGGSTEKLSRAEIDSLAQELAAIARTVSTNASPEEQVDLVTRYLPGDTAPLKSVLLELLRRTP